MYLLADPYPPFSPSSSYPVGLQIAPAVPQNRLTTFFRVFLALPALVINYLLGILGNVIALLGWFASLFLGRMPKGLEDTGLWVLRVNVQTVAYLTLLTDRYPEFGPTPDAPGVVPVPA
jgi:Domain of unknown function (DUF4389)